MTQTTNYRVTGMTCGGCSSAMTKALAKAAPGLKAEVSHEDNQVVVHGAHDPAAIKKATESAGFEFGGAL
ncbi:MAG: copper chaperone [Cognaticolwellia sp.]|jgi:copper chaperone